MSAKSHSSRLLKLYEARKPLYEDFTRTIAVLLATLLHEAGLRTHSITCRTKQPESLRRKLQLEGSASKYNALGDVTDLAGIRVITYFPDEVDRIAALVRDEFEVDAEHSIDKRALLDSDRFGYLSLHYVVGLSRHRRILAEYRRFNECQAEVQVRTILQHTWAEIEHDLGYKTAHAIPRELRRRFARLASLLELADDEFTLVRDALVHYENTVQLQLQTAPQDVAIDQASLGVFLKDPHELSDMHAFVTRHGGSVSDTPSAEFLANLSRGLTLVGIGTLQELREAIAARGGLVLRVMLCEYHGKFSGIGFHAGAPLWHLCHVMALERGGPGALAEWRKQMNDPAAPWQDDVVVCYDRARSANTAAPADQKAPLSGR